MPPFHESEMLCVRELVLVFPSAVTWMPPMVAPLGIEKPKVA